MRRSTGFEVGVRTLVRATALVSVLCAGPAAVRAEEPAAPEVVLRLVDAAGTPVVHHEVRTHARVMHRDGFPGRSDPPASSRTDADGEVRLARWRGSVAAAGDLDWLVFDRAFGRDEGRDGERTEWRAWRRSRVRGRVIDAQGAPLRKAFVVATWQAVPREVETATDADGTFSIDVPAEHPADLRVRTAPRSAGDLGETVAVRSDVAPGDALTLRADPVVVEGRVVEDPAGGPAPYGLLRAFGCDGKATSGALARDGRFRLRVPTPGAYLLQFVDARDAWHEWSVSSGELAGTALFRAPASSVDLRVRPRVPVLGRVAEAGAGCEVAWWEDGAPDAWCYARTDEDGRYALRPVPDAPGRVVARDAATGRFAILAVPSAGDPIPDLWLGDGCRISGRVVRSGTPSGTRVRAAGGSMRVEATVTAEGSFELAGLEPGPLRIEVETFDERWSTTVDLPTKGPVVLARPR